MSSQFAHLFLFFSRLSQINFIRTGAIPLAEFDTTQLDDQTLVSAVNQTKEEMKVSKLSEEQYFISVLQIPIQSEKTKAKLRKLLMQFNSRNSSFYASLTSTSNSSSTSSASVPSSSQAPLVLPSDLLCIRIWHRDVFLGARDSGMGNPGERCMDYWFDQKTAQLLAKMKLDETDELDEEENQDDAEQEEKQGKTQKQTTSGNG